jgi:hypothetical protein
MMEFALVLPILVVLFFAIVDFSRYYAICAVLRAGASDAINRARKIPNFDLDIRGKLPTDRDYVRYDHARNIILDEAERTPFSTLLTSQTSPTDAVLKDITMTDNGLAGGAPAPTTVRSSGVLRPGECADIAGHGTVCNDPTNSGLRPDQLMEKHPIRVIMVAEIRPFLPFIGTLVAKGEAFGYREPVPSGPLAGERVDPDDVVSGPPAENPPVLPGAAAPLPSPSPVPCKQSYATLWARCPGQYPGKVCIFTNQPEDGIPGDNCGIRAIDEATNEPPMF